MKPCIFLFCLFLVGCAQTTPPPQQVVLNKVANQTERLQMVGALGAGVDISLKKDDVPSAAQLNSRIIQIAESPTAKEIDLVAASLTNSDKAKELSAALNKLVEDKRKNDAAALAAIDNLSKENAEYKEQIKENETALKRFDGAFYSIFHGAKIILSRFALFGLGGALVFLLLRLFASSHPAIGAVFGVLEWMVSLLVRTIKSLFPRSLTFSGHSDSAETEQLRHTLKVLIKSIQTEKLSTNPSVGNLLDRIEKECDAADKEQIDEIKKTVL